MKQYNDQTHKRFFKRLFGTIKNKKTMKSLLRIEKYKNFAAMFLKTISRWQQGFYMFNKNFFNSVSTSPLS